MRTLPQAMADIIASGDFTGPQRAKTRVVIYDDPFLGIYPVNDWSNRRDGKDPVQQVYSSLPFRQVEVHGKELPNVKKVRWNRSTGGNIGSCTLELWNTKPLPPGTGPAVGDEFDLLGYYTYNRGRTSYSQTNWGHDENEWRGVLSPDSMIVVYQGYGVCDYDLYPEDDPVLVQTGMWLVDDVTYTADGLITLECRDAGRLLADQISFPPVVPRQLYPQRWEHFNDEPLPDVPSSAMLDLFHPRFDTSSNAPYPVGINGAVHGHYGVDAFDASADSFWLSVGNSTPNVGASYEFVQGAIDQPGFSCSLLRLHVWGGPYRCYVSLRSNGVWLGERVIPYDPNHRLSAPNGANIPYVHVVNVGRDEALNLAFSKLYENVDAVRVTFTDLFHSGLGPFVYRVGVRDIQVAGGAPTLVDGGVDRRGNYGDYSDIVKMLLAWGGFYWPPDGQMFLTGDNTDVYSFAEGDDMLSAETRTKRAARLAYNVIDLDRTMDSIRASVDRLKYGNDVDHWEPLPTDPAQDAPHLPPPLGTGTLATLIQRVISIFDNRGVPMERGLGRIWGDIEMSGTAGKVELGVDIWDKKPLLDCITYIKDILGFIFFVDEHGAAQWRSPNTFRLGNWRSNATGTSLTRTLSYVSILDSEAILGLRAKLSSRNIRDHVFVANVSGKTGAVSAGRVASGGFRRVGGWTDQNFETVEECRKMADLITIRQMFTYRQNSLRIPANPTIQVDDQVEIQERTTGEAYMHYVSAIDSDWELESGVWSYDLTTAWLGEDPSGEWAFNTEGLAPETIEYLAALGQI